jgi:hypothetical protein
MVGRPMYPSEFRAEAVQLDRSSGRAPYGSARDLLMIRSAESFFTWVVFDKLSALRALC